MDNLENLLKHARRQPMSQQERQQQGISYILGNVAVDGVSIFHGTVTRAIPRDLLNPGEKIHSISVIENAPGIHFDLNGAVRQFRLVQGIVENCVNSSERIVIDAELICKLHAATGIPGDPAFGKFREIEIQVGAYRPPPSTEIATLIDAFCMDLNSHWEKSNAAQLAAYALWRLTWIHPFVDANGRTARALCYLILNIKFGMLLPGSPTLPEQLSDRRSEYYDALALADATYAKSGTANVEPLAKLLEELLVRQLRNLPAQSNLDASALSDIFTRLIETADPALLTRVYGHPEIQYRSWASGEVLIVHLGSAQAIELAEALFERYGRPFPGLIAGADEDAVLNIDASQRGAIVRVQKFETSSAAIHLEPNAAVVIESPRIEFTNSMEMKGWEISGAVYLLRSGNNMGVLGIYDALDWLIRRHLQEA